MKKDAAGMSVQDYLLGTTSPQMWWAIIILANIAVFVMVRRRVNKGIKTNEVSPEKFSLIYFLANNFLDIIRTELSIYLFARASLLWVDARFVMAYAIFIGIISDQLTNIFVFIKDVGLVKVKKVIVRIFGADGQQKSEIITTETTKEGETTTETVKNDTPGNKTE